MVDVKNLGCIYFSYSRNLLFVLGSNCLSNLKSVLSTPLGIAVIATCIHNLSVLHQNGDAKVKVFANSN